MSILTRAVAPPAIVDCEDLTLQAREEVRLPVWRNAHETILSVLPCRVTECVRLSS